MNAHCERDDCQRTGVRHIPEPGGAYVCWEHFQEWVESVIDMMEYRLGER